MKTTTLLALLLSGATCASAQTVMTLSAARAAGVGATVAVRGTVLNGAELGSIRYIQDKDAGLATFSNRLPEFSALVPGDSVLITGTLKNYNGLLEMDPVASVTKLASGRKLKVTEVPFASVNKVLDEAYEGRLVKITGVSKLTTMGGSPVNGEFAGNFNYLLNGQAGALMRVSQASTGTDGLVGKIAPESSFDVVGLVGQHSPAGQPGGYQLLPRYASDIVLGGGLPNIMGTPVPTEIGKTSFTVHFQTQNPGTTKVEYGTTAALGGAVSDKVATKDHTITLVNLEPATVYYVRVSSTNEKGTSVSETVPMITDSKNRSRK